MGDLKPPTIVTLVGGVLLLISSFIDWVGFGPFGWNVYESDLFGLSGFFVLVIAAIVIAVPVIRSFAPAVKLPERVLGLTLDEVVMMLGFASFILGFSFIFRDGSQFGVTLATIAGAAITVGSWMERNASIR